MSLAGRTIAITRPAAQLDALAEAIRAAGGTPLPAPLLEIVPDATWLEQHPVSLSHYTLAIFVSPNAVQCSLPLLTRNQTWPLTLQAAAVGPGTAQALADWHLNCLLPESRFDSEGLLARSELQAPAVAGQRVLLLRGDGGRELLAGTLSERGAEVHVVPCYRRQPPANLAAPFRTAWAASHLDGILISSSEALQNLLDALTPAERTRACATPLFVPHPRIADKAHAAGFHTVVLTPQAEAGMLAGLLAYNWSP